MDKLVQILAEGLDLPEGLAFDPEGNLWCVEVNRGSLVRWSEAGLERFAAGGTPCGLTFDRLGRAWICDAGQNVIRRFDPGSGHWETIADSVDGEPLNKPNDLAFDLSGNLVFTCSGDSHREPGGYVCCLRPSGVLIKIAENIYFPTGLAFLAEGRQLVVSETYRQRLLVGSWEAETGTWLNPSPWATIGDKPGPNGLAIGDDGLLYVAVARSGQIVVVDTGGHITTKYDMPGKIPIKVAFDRNQSCPLGLVVTEAERGLLVSLPHLGPGVQLGDGSGRWH